jgi:hypothetical protein
MINQYGDISQRTALYAIAEFLANVDPVLILSKFGQNRPAPKNKAETITFRRAVPFARRPTPLAEGVTPTGHAITFEDVQRHAQAVRRRRPHHRQGRGPQRGPVLKVAMEESGKQAAATIEQITYGVVKAGTSVAYANGAAAQRGQHRHHAQQAARGHPLPASGTRRRSSPRSSAAASTTRPADRGLVHRHHSLRRRAGHPQHDRLHSRSRSTASGSRSASTSSARSRTCVTSSRPTWLRSRTQAARSARCSRPRAPTPTSIRCCSSAWTPTGSCPLKGMNSMSPTVLNPGTPSKSDPLGQRGYVGWKTWFNAVRLNETWMARLEVAATA